MKSEKVLWNMQTLESALYRQQLPAWEAEAYTSFKAKVSDKRFPCPFAIDAQKKGKLLYGFVQSLEAEADLLHTHAVLLEYLERVQGMPPIKAAMTVLILFIKVEGDQVEGGPLSIEAYHRKGWEVLQFLHAHDPCPWPTTVPTDPNDPPWAFCFAGTALFVNMNTPANHMRQSRNLGPKLTLVIQPRDGFDLIAGDTPKGQGIRAFIRDRVAAYDPVAPSPELGTYGDTSKREWKQYGLLDTNDPVLDQCPFPIRNVTPESASPDDRESQRLDQCPFHARNVTTQKEAQM